MKKELLRSGQQVIADVNENEPGYFNEHLEDLKGFIKHLPIAVVITDELGQPITYNQSAVEILGEIPADTRPEEWPKRFSLFLEDGKTYYPEKNFPLQRALKGETVEAEEILYKNLQSDQSKWISLSAKPLKSVTGKIDGLLVFISDISSRKQVEMSRIELLRRAETSYELSQKISKLGNDPLQILNTVVVFASEMLGDGCIAALLTHPKKQLKVVAFHHPKPSVMELLNQTIFLKDYELKGIIDWVVRSKEPLLIPVVDKTNFKQIVQSEYSGDEEIGIKSLLVVPIKGRNRVLGTLALFRDLGNKSFTPQDQSYIMDVAYRTGLAIDNNTLLRSLHMESSGRRIAEKALEFSEVRFQTIFTSTALGIKLLDLNGNILETNPAFQQMLGYTEGELIGNSISTLWHPADNKRLTNLLDELKNDRVQSFQLEHRLLSKDGSMVWVSVTFTGIKKNDQEGSIGFIVAILENITERKRIEAEMVEMKRRLHSHVEMERLQLAQDLHDGPLQDLYSSIYKLENWTDQASDENRTQIELLKHELLNVVQDLRNTAKNLRPPTLTNFGLEKAIRSHIEDFNEKHPELTIHLDLAKDKQSLPEDLRLVLFRIYQNSLTNVIRHAQASEVHIRFSFDAEEATLEIRDNGVGFVVPSSWVELVKQGHFGLAGAVERVGLLEGTFAVESTPGVGTTARVVLPIKENTESANIGLGRVSL